MEVEQCYKVLYDIAQKLNSDLAPKEVLRTIVESIRDAADAKGCSLMLLTPDRQQLIHTVDCGLSNWYVRKGLVRVDAAIVQALDGKPVAILDATTDPRIQYRDQAKKEGVASMLSVPLIRRGQVIGIVRIYTSELRKFSDQEVDFFSTMANLGAVALERAELLDEEKKQFLRFVSIAAHDLKAPLAAIQTSLGVILDGFAGELNEKQKHMMQRASQRINELLNLISNLLDIPRIELGQLVHEMTEVSLAQVIESFVEEGCSLAEQKGLKFSVHMPPSLSCVCVVPARIRQVIANLVNNAVNYTNEGEVVVKAVETDNEILVEVADTGCGIPPDDMPRLFEDFFRGSNVEPKGTGLGLSISKRIVEAHGGKIWAESPCVGTGKGSKFCFTLPKKANVAT
ncbi:MAG: GAF domain-containing sensor histidine kinase [Dehalococcoidia bacterium]|nr:GAF domain-containing sensor histidine kinase [Dehalococcoidia bacterium]